MEKIFSKKTNAQGTIEYLVIIAVVVVIALIVVGLLITLMNSNSSVSGTSNQINYKTQSIALNDYLISTDGNFLFEIKSNEVGTITINNISINGEETPYTTNNKIQLGQEKLIKIESNTTCEEGQKVATQNVTITYTTTNSLTKKQTYENIAIPCQNYTNPNQNQLLGGTNLDTTPPTITLNLPEANTIITQADTNTDFNFTVTDSSTITSCSLYIDNTLTDTNTDGFTSGTLVNIDANLAQFETGDHTWDINCTDAIGNTGTATDRNINYTPLDTTIANLREGLIGYWPLDEGSGTTAYDNSGNNYDGELIDGATFDSGGLIEGAVNLNTRSTSNFKRVRIDIPKQNSFTYQIWSKRAVTGHQEVIYRSSDSTSSPLSMLGFGNNSQFFIKPFGSEIWGPSVSCPGTYCFSDISIWYHVVITYDSTNGELKNYVNNTLIINQSAGTGQTENGDILFLGGRNTSWGGLSGLISEAAFWNRALSSDEIETLYNDGNGLSLKVN